MTLFGWLTVFLWAYGATIIQGPEESVNRITRLMCIFMAVGTLVWGTGSI